MNFTFDVLSFSQENVSINLAPGSSTFFLGANGSGKTRLAAQAENQLGGHAHRISAHRSLSLNPNVAKISERQALNGLRYGYADTKRELEVGARTHGRWNGRAETYLLNDFDYLVQALFADQSNIALQTHNAVHAGELDKPQLTRFQNLIAIWDKVLPHRIFEVTGDDIKVSAKGQQPYSAADMSDGERSVFYMLGQVLLAEPGSVLIFDEPELHVHRAILGRLWDEIERVRPDCAFLVITHDLEFVASRTGRKFVIRSYKAPMCWEIEEVPENTGFSEEIATLILGSRKPILFVEGTGSSLDLVIYRACYPDWTVIPRGSSEDVIHAVATMRHNADLTRITCSGIVDADDYNEEEKAQLAKCGVEVLPVSEIENLFLLPDVSKAILEDERYNGVNIQDKLNALSQEVFAQIAKAGAIEDAVVRYCRRRIDRTLKKIDLRDVSTAADLAVVYAQKTAALDVSKIAHDVRKRIEDAIEDRDLPALLANFDDKGFLALAAKHLKGTSKTAFESWLTRATCDANSDKLKNAIGKVLPAIVAS